MQRIDLLPPLPKARESFDRTTTLAEALALVPELRRRFHIDRIADLTLLDRCRIPVVSAIISRSLDAVSVYNGKGPTRAHAVVGAVMEAVERQAAANVWLPTHCRGRCNDTVDFPVQRTPVGFAAEHLAFVTGYDLIDEGPCDVPLAAVETPSHGAAIPTTTNGLAAGLGVVEAIYHALFELVERHLCSIAQARAHVVPRLLIEGVIGSNSGDWVDKLVDDPVAVEITTPTGDLAIDGLCARVVCAGLSLRIVAFVEGALPPLLVATLAETGDRQRTHQGMGCSWSPRHALVRALTEAVQTRVADTSGSREDIVLETGNASPYLASRTSREPKGRWYYDATRGSVPLASLPDRSTPDVSADVRSLVAALRLAGAQRLVVVDVTPAACGVNVVRIVAPDMETGIIDGSVGPTVASILAGSGNNRMRPQARNICLPTLLKSSRGLFFHTS